MHPVTIRKKNQLHKRTSRTCTVGGCPFDLLIHRNSTTNRVPPAFAVPSPRAPRVLLDPALAHGHEHANAALSIPPSPLYVGLGTNAHSTRASAHDAPRLVPRLAARRKIKSKMARGFVTLGPPRGGGTVRGGPRGGGGRPTGVRGAPCATGAAGAGPGRAATAPQKRVWPRLNLRLSQKWRAGA